MLPARCASWWPHGPPRRPYRPRRKHAPLPDRGALMGWKALQATLAVEVGSASRKWVLALLAWRSCDSCGLAWPGVGRICDDTEMGERSVQNALAELAKAGLIEPRSYATGGRGRSTEYVVLPSRAGLSTAPCQECGQRRRNPANPAGYWGRQQWETPQNPTRKPRKFCTPSTRRIRTTERGVLATARTSFRPHPLRSVAHTDAAGRPRIASKPRSALTRPGNRKGSLRAERRESCAAGARIRERANRVLTRSARGVGRCPES